jgi:hypothetical protein
MLAGGLFQQRFDQRLLNHAGVSDLILAVGRNGLSRLDDEQVQALDRVRAYVTGREQRFAETMDALSKTVMEAAPKRSLGDSLSNLLTPTRCWSFWPAPAC